MKRSIKRLTLNRETVGMLSGPKLAAVAGGSGDTCAPTCNTQCFVCPPSLGTFCSICASDCDTCKGC